MSYSSFSRGGSKASSSTVCQKCLQKGHYSYECKSAVQERPYASRPSRSQQLLNPKLRPTLTNQALQEPEGATEKRGLADQILERNAEERRRKRSLEDGDVDRPAHKRNRSMSASSSDSVSTISTNRSRSRSYSRDGHSTAPDIRNGAKPPLDESRRSSGTKRGRGTSSPSEDGMDGMEDRNGPRADKNTRLRVRSISPQERGRRRHRPGKSDAPIYSHSRSKSSGTRDRGGARRDPPRIYERSLSPFSKRVAMSRGSER